MVFYSQASYPVKEHFWCLSLNYEVLEIWRYLFGFIQWGLHQLAVAARVPGKVCSFFWQECFGDVRISQSGLINEKMTIETF